MIAALYDIHGNLAALEAVLAEVPEEAEIVVGGDVVAGGAEASETLERLRGLGDRVHWLRGNGDRELYPGEEGLAPPESLADTRAQLSDEQIEFLYRLHPTVRIGDVLYVHASPRNDLDIFTEATPEERIAFLFEDVDAGVVVCGHTHMQFDRVVAGTRVVNAGSVGMSYDERPGAYWLLDLEPRFTPYAGVPEPEHTRDEVLAFFTERGL
ncbi:MAG: metallophosphoesterase family protein [Actinomycetota bacterium]